MGFPNTLGLFSSISGNFEFFRILEEGLGVLTFSGFPKNGFHAAKITYFQLFFSFFSAYGHFCWIGDSRTLLETCLAASAALKNYF